MRLNKIICQACHLEIGKRFASAADMLVALREAQEEKNAARSQ